MARKISRERQLASTKDGLTRLVIPSGHRWIPGERDFHLPLARVLAICIVAVNSFVLAIDVIARADRLVGAPRALAQFLVGCAVLRSVQTVPRREVDGIAQPLQIRVDRVQLDESALLDGLTRMQRVEPVVVLAEHLAVCELLATAGQPLKDRTACCLQNRVVPVFVGRHKRVIGDCHHHVDC